METSVAQQSDTALDGALDSVEGAIGGMGPAASIAADLIGVTDLMNLTRATESVAKSFPQCADAVKTAVFSGFLATCKALTGDMAGAQKEVGEIAKHAEALSKISAVLGAATMVGMQFIPLGKVAKLASSSLGRSLGKNLLAKGLSQGLEGKVVKAAGSALENALKHGERDLTKLCDIQVEAIAKVVESTVSSMAEKDVYSILVSLSSKTASKKSVAHTLVGCGFTKKEAQQLAEELIKSNVKGSLKSLKATAEIQEILIESMKESFGEELKANIKKGVFTDKLKLDIAERCKKLRKNGHVIDSKLEADLIAKSDDVVERGVLQGAEEGIEAGVRKAFRKFAFERHMISLRAFIKENKTGEYVRTARHGETLGDIAGDKFGKKFANLTNTWREPTWKERLEDERQKLQAKGRMP